MNLEHCLVTLFELWHSGSWCEGRELSSTRKSSRSAVCPLFCLVYLLPWVLYRHLAVTEDSSGLDVVG